MRRVARIVQLILVVGTLSSVVSESCTTKIYQTPVRPVRGAALPLHIHCINETPRSQVSNGFFVDIKNVRSNSFFWFWLRFKKVNIKVVRFYSHGF